jgi:hypothetical protein
MRAIALQLAKVLCATDNIIIFSLMFVPKRAVQSEPPSGLKQCDQRIDHQRECGSV